MASLVEEVQDLETKIDEAFADQAPPSDGGKPTKLRHEVVANLNARKRLLFNTSFTELWVKAERTSDTEAVAELNRIRAKLSIKSVRSGGIPGKILLILRAIAFAIVASYGAALLVIFSPLRLVHPVFRSFGVPNGWLPMDLCVTAWTSSLLATAGVKVHIDGDTASKVWGSRCGIIVYNHFSFLDSLIVSLVSSAFAPKFVGAKFMFYFPLLGWASMLVGMVPINRGNKEKALATMNETVADILNTWKRCVAIAPEGSHSKDGHMTFPLKKGVFHLQSQTEVPLLPMVIHCAYDLWPRGGPFTSPGEVRVTVLPPFTHDTTKGSAGGSDNSKGTDEARLKLTGLFSEQLAAHSDWTCERLSWFSFLEQVAKLVITFSVFVLTTKLICWPVAASIGLTFTGFLVALIVISVMMALLIEHLL